MKEGVKIYGSFDDGETTLASRTITLPLTNDPAVNTVLNGQGNKRVIINDNNGLSAAAVLDGFVVTGGSGDRGGSSGGGIYNQNASPTLRNLTISGNRVNYYGGGGGMYNNSSSPNIRNSIIMGNTEYLNNTSSEIHNDNSTPNIQYSLVQGMAVDAANHNLDGTSVTATNVFVNPAAASSAPTPTGDYRLITSSPAINAGSNSLYEAADGNSTNNSINNDSDLGGLKRLHNSTIDMGPYEQGSTPLAITLGSFNATWLATAFW
ncbi:choice-of-anchor Q domain-containing protein [Niabella ginsengisoli]|uniref:Right-handed parallel beta-helix repeat-containing protein n=1 Tax=Niabella ginsengisoli TaxID=522298 RepID=A0ABS9SFC0_9BACT|nr:choice-of-anchor Q domain-containing protein [Niabella ginsengisoli]MCH5597062.1 hypothetical protein [Niabella ginsengisoli]